MTHTILHSILHSITSFIDAWGETQSVVLTVSISLRFVMGMLCHGYCTLALWDCNSHFHSALTFPALNQLPCPTVCNEWVIAQKCDYLIYHHLVRTVSPFKFGRTPGVLNIQTCPSKCPNMSGFSPQAQINLGYPLSVSNKNSTLKEKKLECWSCNAWCTRVEYTSRTPTAKAVSASSHPACRTKNFLE